jgi:trk system potassium uptake protein TrkH
MLRTFNFQAQVLVILVLGLTQVYPVLFPTPEGWPLIVDVLSIFSIVHLVGGYLGFVVKNFRRLPLTAARWVQSRESQRMLVILREFAIWTAVGFLVLRISRWTLGWEAGWRMSGLDHYNNYVDAALFLLGCSLLLSMRRVTLRLSRLDLTSGRRLILSYVVLIIGATFLLMLPFAVLDGQQLELVDAAFTVVSALSVTGLASVNIAEVLSLSGQTIVLLLIQIGGLGIVAITAALAAATLRQMSLNQSMVGKELYDIPDFGNMSQFVAKVTGLTFGLELLGTFALYFSLPSGLENRFFHALFHSVSAFCNAGFSTLPANLENSPFAPWGLGVLCLLIVIGGLGFPLLFELMKECANKRWKSHISVNSRLTLIVTAVLLVGGALVIFLMQSFAISRFPSAGDRFWHSLFYSVSSRTAGFNMTPVSQLSQTSVLVIMLLMVVGGGPMSTAGGIKTTTLGVLAATAWATITGRTGAQFMHRRIPDLTIHRAVTGVVLYVFVASIATVLLVLTESIDPWAILFEVISALSTVGLSLGATTELSGFGKILVILLMLMGRIGLVTFVYAGIGRRAPRRYRYPQDSFFVG